MKKNLFKSVLTSIAASALVIGLAITSLADTVVVSGDGTNIRSSASVDSSAITQASSGTEYEVLDTVTGDDGNTWYKISINGSTGYIRSDLARLKKDDAGNADTEPNTATSPEPTTPTAMSEKTATVIGNDPVNIRSGAGTGYDKVGSLQPGVSITLIGEANDSSGKKWYQFKCQTPNIEGYIRSDFVSIQEDATTDDEGGDGSNEYFDDENIDGSEATGADEYVEGDIDSYDAESVNNDYEIVYTADDAGEYQYYLYNHIDNTRQKVVDLLGAISTLNTNYEKVNHSLTLFKILTIVFGVLMVVFLGLAIVLFIRLRSDSDDYYDDDDDYDDDDEEEEEEVKPKKSRPIREEDIEITAAAPSRRMRASDEDAAPRGRETSRRSSEDSTPRRPRKPQNFLADDDEFEFEFLNMDDKDN